MHSCIDKFLHWPYQVWKRKSPVHFDTATQVWFLNFLPDWPVVNYQAPLDNLIDFLKVHFCWSQILCMLLHILHHVIWQYRELQEINSNAILPWQVNFDGAGHMNNSKQIYSNKIDIAHGI